MKIIDLLNKIANGEEVPEEIIFKGKRYHYNDGVDYEYGEGNYLLSSEPICIRFLNDEVSILEEEKKIPEKLYEISDIGDLTITYPNNEQLMNKINEIIDYLKSKGD